MIHPLLCEKVDAEEVFCVYPVYTGLNKTSKIAGDCAREDTRKKKRVSPLLQMHGAVSDEHSAFKDGSFCLRVIDLPIIFWGIRIRGSILRWQITITQPRKRIIFAGINSVL